MYKIAAAIITSALIVSAVLLLHGRAQQAPAPADMQPTANVEVRDGVQYITLTARGGYTPEVSVARGDLPTKLVVRTNGTYDCSASLVIGSIGYRKTLPQTGEEAVDLATPRAQTTLKGTCSMGMYAFSVRFL